MAKGSGGTRSKSWRDKGSISFDGETFRTPQDVYAYWMTGHAPNMNNFYDGYALGNTAPEPLKKLFDKAFSPTERDFETYKGVPGDMQDYIERMVGSKDVIGKSFIDKFYSSTSPTQGIAESYSTIDDEDVASIVHFNIKKGTPIANPAKDGTAKRISYNEDELTIRRNVRYTVRRIVETPGEDYTYKHFYIDVSPVR